MRGRYALFQIEQLRERFRIANDLPDGLKTRYDIGPSQLKPVIAKHVVWCLRMAFANGNIRMMASSRSLSIIPIFRYIRLEINTIKTDDARLIAPIHAT